MAFWNRFGRKREEKEAGEEAPASGLHHQLRYQVEYHMLPELLREHARTFLPDLEAKKGAAMARFYRNVYAQHRAKSPYGDADFTVTRLPVMAGKSLLRIDMPQAHLLPPLCARVYLLYDAQYRPVGYYTLEMSMGSSLFRALLKDEQMPGETPPDRFMMCAIENREHVNYGECEPDEIEGRILEAVLRGQ